MHSCRDLLIGLDLTSLNPTQVPITFVHSAKITVDYIRFDKTFAGNQKLVTKFRNVEHVAFQGLHVDEAIEVMIIMMLYSAIFVLFFNDVVTQPSIFV